MKKNLFAFVFILTGLYANAQNGLENITVEKYYISNAADAAGSIGTLPTGSVTYRIYADMLPGYRFQAAYGVPGHTLTIATTTTFFNNEDYGATTPAFSKTNAAKNSVMLDSWLSVGAACSANYGILKSEDNVSGGATVVNNTTPQILQNADPLAGIPLTTQDGIYAGTPEAVTFVGITTNDLHVFDATSQAGNLFTTSNGSWAALNGALGPVPATNRVLIAQLTTTGCLSFELNIQIGTPNGGVENYVAKNPVGNEILLPSLTYGGPATVAVTANPSGAICSGTSVTFTATPSNAGASVSYQWKKNGANVGTNSPTYTPGSLANNNTIKCVITTSGTCVTGSPATSNTITMAVKANPTATITVNGPTTYCSGTTPLTLSANSGTGLSYQWFKGSTSIAGATGINYSPTSSGTYTYKVRVTNANGCTKLSSGVSVTVNALPSATITAQGPTTFCAGDSVVLTANSGTGFLYQWKKNNTNISGATNQNYTAKTGGTYKVKVTKTNGCSKISSGKTVTVNCRNGNMLAAESTSPLSLYPNPNNGDFSISLNLEETEEGTALIQVMNVLGKVVVELDQPLSEGQFQHDFKLAGLQEKGVYFVRVIYNGREYNEKVVLQ